MSIDTSIKEFKFPKPFLKWAGGKRQLILELESRLPQSILESKVIKSYVEPFVGGGAMFFFLKSNYQVKKSLLADVNQELIMAYQVVKNDHTKLISQLKNMEKEHLQKSEKKRKENYYQIRNTYNQQLQEIDHMNYDEEWIKRVAYLIFLNKTCFNGLFRLNSRGEFNVPFGKYNNPTICNELNIGLAHKALEKTKILCTDFTDTHTFIEKGSLVYLDPPYRPLNSTSHFTGYSPEGFNDQDQQKLAEFYKKMDNKGAHLILSNSDPKNQDPHDNFFDKLYQDYNIERVPAKRNINSKTSLRGEIKEIIVRNYSQ